VNALSLRRFILRIRERARGKVSLRDLTSIRKWQYWWVKGCQEFQSVRSEKRDFSIAGEREAPYNAYIRSTSLRPHVRALLAAAINGFSYQPVISIVMPVYNGAPRWLTEAVTSVHQQVYPFWELCIVDDGSSCTETVDTLKAMETDNRIKVLYRSSNGNICVASNQAAAIARGDYLCFLDQDDLLAPHALFEMVRLLQKEPEAAIIYSDEDKISPRGDRYDPFLKPDWSPTLLLGYNYINHFMCIRRTLFESLGGFRPGYEGAQDYDLLLRAAEQTEHIWHVPKILYHWRADSGSVAYDPRAKPQVATSAHKALQDHLKRRKICARTYLPAFARLHSVPVFQLDWPDTGPQVDIIVPTHNHWKLLERLIDAIRSRTTYQNYAIMVIDNESCGKKDLAYLKTLPEKGVRVLRISNPDGNFSFSRICNEAVKRTKGEYILFLNNDTEVLEPRWLSRMMGYCQMPGVGAAGTRLLFPDQRIQHAGVVLGMTSGIAPAHAFYRQPSRGLSYFFLAETAREVSAVTGAAMLTRRDLFLNMGGFDEARFRISMNDVDYCLRLREKGLRTVYVGGAELTHHESASRGLRDDPSELSAFRRQYGTSRDPYYHPHFSTEQSYALNTTAGLDYAQYLGRPLRVFLFSHNLNVEGATLVLSSLARSLQQRGKLQVCMVSFVDGPLRKALELSGVSCRILNLPGAKDLLKGWLSPAFLKKDIQAVSAFLKKEKPEVVVANILNSFFVINAAAGLRIPSLWLIHEAYTRALMLRYTPQFALSMYEKAFSEANRVVFVSRETSELYRRYDLQRNFVVMHNSVDNSAADRLMATADPEQVRKDLGISKEKKLILNVGTLCERKDQATIVKAAAVLKRSRSDFVCFLVGAREKTPYVRYIRRLITDLGVEDLVKVVPETQDVNRYYRAAHIFAFTSHNESFSLTILEAMAFALPIVSTRCGGVAEQVRWGVNALDIGFSDVKGLAFRLDFLLSESQKGEVMGENSRHISRYMKSPEEMHAAYEELILGVWQEGSQGNRHDPG
jgi:O-antigen biosynthesis protein